MSYKVKPIPKKSLGQHFLSDEAIVKRIITTINPRASECLVEIGPGAGALTANVLAIVHKLDVVEFDRDIIPLLKENCLGLGELRVHEGDVLKFDFLSLGCDKLRIFGNLPYNISSPILFHVLKSSAMISDMHFMLQLEVAERICANHGTKIYGRLSVMIQYYCEANILFHVPPESFDPPPKVDSAVVRLVPRKRHEIEVVDAVFFADIVRVAFSQRRKMISNSLKKMIDVKLLKEVAIDPCARPEQLSFSDFARIANFFSKELRHV